MARTSMFVLHFMSPHLVGLDEITKIIFSALMGQHYVTKQISICLQIKRQQLNPREIRYQLRILFRRNRKSENEVSKLG